MRAGGDSSQKYKIGFMLQQFVESTEKKIFWLKNCFGGRKINNNNQPSRRSAQTEIDHRTRVRVSEFEERKAEIVILICKTNLC